MSDLLKHHLYHTQGGGASLGQAPPVPFAQVGVSRAAQQGVTQSAPRIDSAYSRALGGSGGQYTQPGTQTAFEVGGMDRVSFQFRGSCVNAVCCWDGWQCPHLRDMVLFQSDLYREVPRCVGIWIHKFLFADSTSWLPNLTSFPIYIDLFAYIHGYTCTQV